MVFQLEVYFEVDRLLNGLTVQQKGTTARWYSNKTSQCMFYLSTIEQLDQLEVCLPHSNWNTNTGGIPKFKVEFK